MKNNNSDITTECPSLEVIGAWFDGELSEESPEAVHIRNCAHCTRQVQMLELFENSLKHRFAAVDEAALINRVTAGVHRQLAEVETPGHSHHFMSLAFKLAASIVICASAVVFFMRDEPTAQVQEPTIASNDKPLQAKDFPYYTNSQSQIGSLVRNGNTIPLHNLATVDFGNSSSPVFSGAKEFSNYAAAQEKPVTIPDHVNQVWLVDKLPVVEKKLNSILQAEGVPQICYRISASDKTLALTARLSKMQLVKLVRGCSKAGYDLVSPISPQPEQNIFSGSADAPTLYQAKFLINK